MGIDFIVAKTASYIQRRDSSKAMTNIAELLDRLNPDRVREKYTVQLRDQTTVLEPGYRALIVCGSESEATVSQNGKVIGDLLPHDAKEISSRLKSAGKTTGMVQVFIREQQDISGCFKVEPVEPKDQPK